MRNLKKYLSVLIAVAMILTAMAPAFAAGFTYEAQGQALKDLGIIEGVSETDLGLGLDLNREQGIKLVLGLVGKLKAAEALTDADVTSALANYTDAATVSDWAKPYVAYAVKNNIVDGMDATTLAPQVKLSGKMLATLILRNLGYTVNDNDYANAAGILAEKGGLTATQALAFNNKDLIRDDMAAIAFGALKIKDAAGKTVIENLVAAGVVSEAKAIAAGLMTAAPTPTPEAFTVKSVTSESLVKVVVTFNKAIDEDSIGSGDFEIDNYDGAALTEDDVELSADGKTATITLDPDFALTDGDDYELTVSDITSTDEEDIEDVTADFTVSDTTVPQALSIKFVGPETAEITFSEPISEDDSDGEIDIDDGMYSATIATGFDGDDTITVDFGTELDEGDHTFKIKGFSDFSPRTMSVKTFNEKYESIDTAPTAKVIDADQSSVTLEFSRPITGFDLTNFYQTYSSWHPLEIQDDDDAVLVASSATDGGTINYVDGTDYYDTIKLIFTYAEENAPYGDDGEDMPLPVGTVKVGITGDNDGDFVGTDRTIEDRWENEFDDSTISATVVADTEAPTVTKVTVEEENEIRIYFSEDVKASDAEDQDNYVIKDSDGEEVDQGDWTIDSSNLADDNYVTINFEDDLDNGDYTVTVSGISDTSVDENEIAEVTEKFTITDISNDGDITATWVEEEQTLYVDFGEEMTTSGTGSVLDIDNFRIGATKTSYTDLDDDSYVGLDLDDSVKLSMFNSEILKIKYGTDATGLAGSWLQVGRVLDKAGNALESLAVDVSIGAEDTTPALTYNKKIDNEQFKFKFDEEIKSIGSNAIYVTKTGVADGAYASVKFVNEDDEGVLTLTVPDRLKSIGTGTTDKASYTFTFSDDKIKTMYGSYIDGFTFAGAGLGDGMAPEMVELDKDVNALGTPDDDQVAAYAYSESGYENADGDTLADRIYIRYSENINANSLSKYTYSVSGGKVVSVGVIDVTPDVGDIDDIDIASELNTSVIGQAADDVSGEWVVITIKTTDEDYEIQTDHTVSVTQTLGVQDTSSNELKAQSAVRAMSADDVAAEL